VKRIPLPLVIGVVVSSILALTAQETGDTSGGSSGGAQPPSGYTCISRINGPKVTKKNQLETSANVKCNVAQTAQSSRFRLEQSVSANGPWKQIRSDRSSQHVGNFTLGPVHWVCQHDPLYYRSVLHLYGTGPRPKGGGLGKPFDVTHTSNTVSCPK
jgi:hypothetical protein